MRVFTSYIARARVGPRDLSDRALRMKAQGFPMLRATVNALARAHRCECTTDIRNCNRQNLMP
jgi:hypothetical protein